MGWHVNHGPEHMADYYPAAYFHKSKYRPDVIRRIIDAGTPLAALYQADAESDRQTHEQSLSASLPPQVTITSPASSTQPLSDGSIRLEATAQPQSADPIVGMHVLVDGRPVVATRDASGLSQVPAADTTTAVKESWTVAYSRRACYWRSGRYQIQLWLERSITKLRITPDKVVKPRLFILAVGVWILCGRWPG